MVAALLLKALCRRELSSVPLSAFKTTVTGNTKLPVSCRLRNHRTGLVRFFSTEDTNDYIGIDLGTTNTRVAVMEQLPLKVDADSEGVWNFQQIPKIIEDSEGARATPSVVSIRYMETPLVGAEAKRRTIEDPTNTISGIKRLIGRRFIDPQTHKQMKMVPYKIIRHRMGDAHIESYRQSYSPSKIDSFILSTVKKTAEDYLGNYVKEAVITVPAYFNNAQRLATKDAGIMAGIPVVSVVSEPIAAALSYGFTKERGLVAVFDLGGGTFDVSILEMRDGVFEVKATNGDLSLGGEDFDNALVEFLVSEFKRTEEIDLSKDELALQRLREVAEKAKIELSSTPQTEINMPLITANAYGAKHLSTTLTRSKFDSLVDHLIDRTKAPCMNCLNDAGISTEDIDEVLLVGGMAHIPKVQKVVEEIFGKSPLKDVNPDEAVAMGAAIQGAIHRGEQGCIFPLDIPVSLGIETLGGIFTRLVKKHTLVPTKISHVFSTVADNQSQVSIKIYRGERAMASDNVFLGELELIDIPRAPRGVPQIEVTFDIDEDRVLSVSAKEMASSKVEQVNIYSSCFVDFDQAVSIDYDAHMNAEKDREKKAMIETNAYAAMYTSIEKSLREYRITSEVMSKHNTSVSELKMNIDDMKSKLDATNKRVMKLEQQLSGGSSNSDSVHILPKTLEKNWRSMLQEDMMFEQAVCGVLVLLVVYIVIVKF